MSRRAPAGRRSAEGGKKDAELESVLERVVEPETAGDPMKQQKWIRSSLRHVSQHLTDLGHGISPPTVGRLLRKLGYSLHTNEKKLEASANHPERNTQFASIQAQKEQFQASGAPIISVDTKKKELIGNFKNAGRAWTEEPEAVNAHDFHKMLWEKRFLMAFMMSFAIVGPFTLVLPLIRLNLRLLPLLAGGRKRDVSLILRPSRSSFWQIVEGVMDVDLACGNNRCKSTSPIVTD